MGSGGSYARPRLRVRPGLTRRTPTGADRVSAIFVTRRALPGPVPTSWGPGPPAYLLPAVCYRLRFPMRLPSPIAQRVLFPVVVVLLFGAVPQAVPQTADDALARVQAGLEEGDPAAVLVDAPARVEVVLFGQGGTFRRAQAVHVLRDFFRRYPPARVAFPERSSSDEGQTAIGSYWTEDGGAPLSVRVLHRQSGEDWELASIRIDRWSTVRTGGR